MVQTSLAGIGAAGGWSLAGERRHEGDEVMSINDRIEQFSRRRRSFGDIRRHAPLRRTISSPGTAAVVTFNLSPSHQRSFLAAPGGVARAGPRRSAVGTLRLLASGSLYQR